MKKAVACVTLLLFSRLALSLVIPYLPLGNFAAAISFLAPLCVLLLPYFATREKLALDLSAKKGLPYVSLLPIFLLGVIAISTITAKLLLTLGYTPTPVLPHYGVASIIIFNILLPVVCEELFFRYAILGALSPYGKAGAVVASAMLFALTHGNYYQMPYAFFAGLFLGAVTVASGSLFPALIFHAANNTLTVTLYHSGANSSAIIYAALALLLPVSFILTVKNGAYKNILSAMTDGSVKKVITDLACSFVIVYIVIALCFSK